MKYFITRNFSFGNQNKFQWTVTVNTNRAKHYLYANRGGEPRCSYSIIYYRFISMKKHLENFSPVSFFSSSTHQQFSYLSQLQALLFALRVHQIRQLSLLLCEQFLLDGGQHGKRVGRFQAAVRSLGFCQTRIH